MRNWCGLLVAMVALGCYSRDDSASVALNPEEMIPVLVDFHLAHAALDLMELPDDARNQQANVFYSEIFSIHGIDADDFFSSFDFYLGNPEQLHVIYEEVVNRISELNTEAGIHVTEPVEINRSRILQPAVSDTAEAK
jgi:hypothetical protein